MNQVKQSCSCGKQYCPNQWWQHKGCPFERATNPDRLDNPMVVNSGGAVVVNRKQDRHKDKDARKVYLREYMRKKRALARAVS